MLGLKLPTEKTWVYLVKNDLETTLSTHAWAEQKATSNAISLIVKYPELDELVETLMDIAQEEMAHFKQVYKIIKQRNYKLKAQIKDYYVNDLLNFVRKGQGRDIFLLDRLLFAAMIEARSCERFKVLTENAPDEELKNFYYKLMVSEARHYTTFLKLAKKYLPEDVVEKRWQEFLDYEAQIIKKYNKSPEIHG